MGARSVLRRIERRVLERVPLRRTDVRLPTPTCSITFDDVPRSAFLNGVPLLRRHGATATFYVAGGLCVDDSYLQASDLRALIEDGFDLGCHTYSHYSLFEGTAGELARDAARNQEVLTRQMGLPRARDFSYPFGEVSVAARREVGRQYATARSIFPGVNGSGTDLLLLRANRVYSSVLDWREIQNLLARAVSARGWVIFYTHGVEAQPNKWSCRPEDLDRLLEECHRVGLALRSVGSVSKELVPQFQIHSPPGVADGRG